MIPRVYISNELFCKIAIFRRKLASVMEIYFNGKALKRLKIIICKKNFLCNSYSIGNMRTYLKSLQAFPSLCLKVDSTLPLQHQTFLYFMYNWPLLLATNCIDVLYKRLVTQFGDVSSGFLIIHFSSLNILEEVHKLFISVNASLLN